MLVLSVGCHRGVIGSRRLKMIRRRCGREEAVGGCSSYRLGVIAASSDPRRLKMIRRRCGREEAVGGCSSYRLGVIAASSDPGG